jgi:tetratricopeptide (TPR) repeat protein
MRKRNRHLQWGVYASLAVLLLIIGLYWHARFSSERVAPPSVDFKGLEPQVVEKIRGLQKEVEKNPRSATAWGKLGMNLDIHDLKQEALLCYQKAAELDPAEFRWPYYSATMLAESGTIEALPWFQRARQLNPDYPPLNILYGQMLLSHHRIGEASAAFEQALRADSKSSHAYLGLAQVALMRNDINASRRYLLQAAQINPNHREAHSLLAEVYRRMNQPEKAEQEIRLASALPKITAVPDPLYTELTAEGYSSYWFEKRGFAYLEKGRYSQAADEFRRVLQIKPSAEAHSNLAFTLQQQANYDEAAQHYRAALALKPNDRDALNNLATVLFRLGNVEDAITYLVKAKQLYPNFPDAYYNLGTFYWRSGRVAEAIVTFKEGLRNAPYDARSAIRLAWLLATSSEASLRDGSEALELAKTVCAKTMYRAPEALDVLAAAYGETAQFSKAVHTARQARELALTANRSDLANQIESRLQMYLAKQPYREKRRA